MRKRLRKKKRLGEFREFGFEIRVTTPGFTPAEVDGLLDRWISFAESQNLQFGGGARAGEWSGFVAHQGRGSATAAHREAVAQWLREQPGIADVQVSGPIDAWYGPFD